MNLPTWLAATERVKNGTANVVDKFICSFENQDGRISSRRWRAGLAAVISYALAEAGHVNQIKFQFYESTD